MNKLTNGIRRNPRTVSHIVNYHCPILVIFAASHPMAQGSPKADKKAII
jgi:hypothetical protein